MQPATGEPIPVSLSAAAVYDDRDSLTEILLLARDITHRTQVDAERERLLAENQLLAANLAKESDVLRTIMEHTDVHLAYLDPGFRFVRVNTAYAGGSGGYAKEELLGRGHFDLFPNPENQAIFEQVRETGGEAFRIYAKPFVYENQPERGTTCWDWSLVPVKDTQGAVHGLVFSLADVTERIRAEEEVRIRNRRLAVLNAVITASASAFTLDELLDNALDASLKNLGFDVGSIYMLEGADRMHAVIRCHRKVSEFTLMQNRTLNTHHRPYNRVFVAGQRGSSRGRRTRMSGILTSSRTSASPLLPSSRSCRILRRRGAGGRKHQHTGDPAGNPAGPRSDRAGGRERGSPGGDTLLQARGGASGGEPLPRHPHPRHPERRQCRKHLRRTAR
ncbi:PAS domain S-box protein [Methanoculleus chikugoensis]|uniref:PAS domain S-box protein n=1 Tax=Methanoculleus chikugoensis TaxID=118126 RepID=UPI000A562EDE|nr:PAS domain S-box protein [Methanoculleus chikugoensis]